MYELVKRAFDLVLSVVLLILFSPLLIAVAIAVKRGSPGPVLYRGLRTGRYGRPFHMFKFRTMVVNAENLGGSSTGKGDARVTPVGLLLRKTKLDELAQLLNVFRGEMSFVGPRPEVPQYTKLYLGDELDILEVRPGITDLSSLEFIALDEVLGSENPDLVYEEKVKPIKNRLRVRYVRERGIITDLKILFRTGMKVLHR